MDRNESGGAEAPGAAPAGPAAIADAERVPDAGMARRAWSSAPPGRLIARGHPAGDFLDAFDWELLEERPGYLKLRAGLPDRAKNPRGQLFGGFTPTYVDLVALFTVRAGRDRSETPRGQWLVTTNMRVDYFEPIVGPTFVIESTEERQRGRTHFVATRFFQDSELAVFALTTMRQVAVDRPLGDA
ncbi:MAG: PaaI family thioesterase [Acidimicrobiales bacterium]|jgi:acyl-coenzyme A thioesterase PaaI-like protein